MDRISNDSHDIRRTTFLMKLRLLHLNKDLDNFNLKIDVINEEFVAYSQNEDNDEFMQKICES